MLEWIRPHNRMTSKLICEMMDLVYQVISTCQFKQKTPQIHHHILPICLPRDVSSSGRQKQCSFHIVLFHYFYDLLYRHQIWTYRCFWCCSFLSTVHVFTVPCTDFRDPSRGRRSFSIIDKRLANSHSLHHSLILHRGQTECCN